jgi:hypothetical protein
VGLRECVVGVASGRSVQGHFGVLLDGVCGVWSVCGFEGVCCGIG